METELLVVVAAEAATRLTILHTYAVMAAVVALGKIMAAAVAVAPDMSPVPLTLAALVELAALKVALAVLAVPA